MTLLLYLDELLCFPSLCLCVLTSVINKFIQHHYQIYLSKYKSNEVKQRRSRLVSGWVTAVLDFVEDPVSRYKNITKALLTLCMLGNFACFFVLCHFFFN